VTVRILEGHVLDVLATLADESVHCVVTSPPYYGLRDYDLPPQVWGGDPHCTACQDIDAGAFCRHCGAWRGDLGLEPSPELYIEHLLAVFREVWRVLRADGTLWLNIADSYCSRGSASGALAATGLRSPARAHLARPEQGKPAIARRRRSWGEAKNKDLFLIPPRLALELRAAGWYVRKDNIVHKRNPIPESVEDRTTSAHEYVFHLSKSETYWYDAAAIREPFVDDRMGRDGGRGQSERNRGGRTDGFTKPNNIDPSTNGGRNRRSVWTISTRPTPEAHFATMAPLVAEICILAGCPAGGVVLDPFLGSGTTAIVADRLARDCIGIELSPGYVAMADRRAREPGFALLLPAEAAA
jgi:DNA modification methylase